MAPFYSIYVARSDGKLQIRTSKSTVEANEPLSDQLDQTPNAQGVADFYRHCQCGETKELEWRRKLGGMLMREIGSKEHKDRNFILAVLPENYRVYEHVKSKISEKDGKTRKITKSHAAGGNERQDAYLYGHPSGRKKRYRSPAEFFPHLLWLATDPSGDSNNCSCKFCSPEELDLEEKPQTKSSTKDAKQESVHHSRSNSKTAPVTSGRSNTSQAMKKASSNDLTPLPRFRSFEQKLDAQGDKFLYRCGEIVWFARGAAWGLGVIFKRDSSLLSYRIQPLSHPFHHPVMMTCKHEQLRPWLAWSPPPCTCADLNPSPSNHNRMVTYNTIDWRGVLAGKYGHGDPEVDGSIFAVKAAETTFTPFDPVNSNTSTNTISYNGIYIGGEKIWVGDALRLRNSAFQTDILVLHEIVEHPPISLQDSSRPRITLIGDTYSCRIAKLEPEAVPRDDLHLPQRVRQDLQFRNNIASKSPDPTKRVTYFWRLNSKGLKLEIADIKGRWYETEKLLPVLDQENFKRSMFTGELNDAGLYMNAQGDCNRLPPGSQISKPRPADTKARKREDAFVDAVPKYFKISKGLDEAKRETPSLNSPLGVSTTHVTKQTDNQNYSATNSSMLYPSHANFINPTQAQRNTTSLSTNPNYNSAATWQPSEGIGANNEQTKVQNDGQTIQYDPGNSGTSIAGGNAPENSLDQFLTFEEGAPDLNMPDYGQNFTSQDLGHEFFSHDMMH